MNRSRPDPSRTGSPADSLTHGFRHCKALKAPQRRPPLPTGRSVITARVYSADNRLASREVRAVVTVSPSTIQPTLHVMTVGVTNYRDRALQQGVRFAADDARAMAAALADQRRAATTRVAKAVVLIDRDATRERIISELKAMAGRVQPNDLFVLHLAGHGTALADGEFHFLPWDLRYTGATAIAEEGLSGEQLRQLLRGIRANKTLVLLDTCSSGAFRLLGGPVGRSLGDKGSIDRFARMSGRVVLAAAGDQRMALESLDNQRGIFTGAVIRGLLGSADLNRNATLEVGELANFVEEEVARLTRQLFNYEQYPMRETQGQSFPVTRVGTAAP